MEQQQTACPLTRGDRILVALDGSIHSEKALDQAISMAKVCNSTIFAISVVAVVPALEEKMSKKTKENLKRARGKSEKENIPCETIFYIGENPHEFIVQEAKDRTEPLRGNLARSPRHII